MSWMRSPRSALAGFALVALLLAGVFALNDADRRDAHPGVGASPEPSEEQRVVPPAPRASPTTPQSPAMPFTDLLQPEGETGEPFVDEEGRPSRDLVRAALEVAIAEHYASYKLSEDDLERLTDAVLRIREARLALARLPENEEVAPLRRGLVQEIEDAGRSFAEVMEMGLESFTAGAGGGVDRFDPDEPVPEPEFLTEPR